MILLDLPNRRLMDAYALAYLLDLSPRTVRKHCTPVARQGAKLLYDAARSADALEKIKTRRSQVTQGA